MAVPARDVLRVKARQLARLHDHVLEHLVQRVANVQLAVGIGRAVVQHKQRCAVAGDAQFFVQAFLLPALDPGRLALGQVAPHGEGRVGQVQGGAVIGSGGHLGTLAEKAGRAGVGGKGRRGPQGASR